MRPFHRILPLLLLTCFVLIPSAAAAGSGTADFAVSQTVHQGDSDSGPIADPSAGILIGDQLTFVYDITDLGPDTPAFEFKMWYPSIHNQYYAPALPGSWTWSPSTCQNPAGIPDIQCPAGTTSLHLTVDMVGWGPGTATVTGTVSSAETDPDPSNNHVEWQTDVRCSINGTPGDDVLQGTGGFDTICGDDGSDTIYVGPGDRAWGGNGDDTFYGQAQGNLDTESHATEAIGGPGFDTVSFENADRGVTVCKQTSSYAYSQGGYWGPDIMVDIERFIGSHFNDTLQGSKATDVLIGRGGRDRIIGRGGDDVLKGGPGRDRFIARNRSKDVAFHVARDTIEGGRGRDAAWVDQTDVVRSATTVSTEPFDPCAG